MGENIIGLRERPVLWRGVETNHRATVRMIQVNPEMLIACV